jgi:hypothetical protein
MPRSQNTWRRIDVSTLAAGFRGARVISCLLGYTGSLVLLLGSAAVVISTIQVAVNPPVDDLPLFAMAVPVNVLFFCGASRLLEKWSDSVSRLSGKALCAVVLVELYVFLSWLEALVRFFTSPTPGVSGAEVASILVPFAIKLVLAMIVLVLVIRCLRAYFWLKKATGRDPTSVMDATGSEYHRCHGRYWIAPRLLKKCNEWSAILMILAAVAGILLSLKVVSPIGLGLNCLLSVVSVKSHRRWSAIGPESVEQALKADERAPIVLLRSFNDDDIAADKASFGLDPDGAHRFEETLAVALWRSGPVIAIGMPGEGRPRLGAARTYVADDKWQDLVLSWLKVAARIVVLAGRTPGLGWELTQILQRRVYSRLVCIFPAVCDEDVAQRWRVIEYYLGDILPTGDPVMFGEKLLAITWSAQSVCVFASSQQRSYDYDAVFVLVEALRDSGSYKVPILRD